MEHQNPNVILDREEGWDIMGRMWRGAKIGAKFVGDLAKIQRSFTHADEDKGPEATPLLTKYNDLLKGFS